MPSPFPGMDPYIEACNLWGDFHSNLIGEIQRVLADVLPERYVVRAEQRSYVTLLDVDDEQRKSSFVPDVAIETHRRSPRKRKETASLAAARGETGPVMMRALVKVAYREPFLEIYQTDPERKLVTGIEVLSPSNKRYGTKGWRLYYRKRLAFLSVYANLVELDLLRQGRRMPMSSPWPDSPY